jgi:hypothetical protein
MLIKRTDDYDIVYLGVDESFLITLSREPIPNSARVAEEDFVALLGVSQSDACKLPAVLAVPSSVNPSYPDQYSLSFCLNSGLPRL